MTMTLNSGITRAGTGKGSIQWNSLGQRYFPKADCDGAFTFGAISAPGQSVPVRVPPGPDGFILLQEGQLGVKLDGVLSPTRTRDRVGLPRGVPPGYCNTSDLPVRAMVRVAPAGKRRARFETPHDRADRLAAIAAPAAHGVGFPPAHANA